MANAFWAGPGWEIINFGRLTEVKLSSPGTVLHYLLIFQKEQQGVVLTEEIADELETAGGAPDDIPNLNELAITFEVIVDKLKPRTVLSQADLAMLVQSKVQVPDFYKYAVQGQVHKIILI